MVSLKPQRCKIEAQKTDPTCWCVRTLFPTLWDGCTRSEYVGTLFATLWEGLTNTGSAFELDLLCSVLDAYSICENTKTLKRIVAPPHHFNCPCHRSFTEILRWYQQDHIKSGAELPVSRIDKRHWRLHGEASCHCHVMPSNKWHVKSLFGAKRARFW